MVRPIYLSISWWSTICRARWQKIWTSLPRYNDKTIHTPNSPIIELLNPADSDETDSDIPVHCTQTVKDSKDPRIKEPGKKEYDGIKAKGGVIFFDRAKLSPNWKIIWNRFILVIKDPGIKIKRQKARWIQLGYNDILRHKIANNSLMLMRLTYCIVVSFAVIFFVLVFLDLQCWKNLHASNWTYQRHIYITTSWNEPLLHQIRKVARHNYGLVESNSCFIDTYHPNFTEKLKQLTVFFDHCIQYRKLNGILTGITRLALDDFINAWLSEYQQTEELHSKSFITRKTATFPFRFLEIMIEYEEMNTGLCVFQDTHIKKLKFLSTISTDQDAFRFVGGQPLYIEQTTRPGVCYRVS